LIDCRGTSANRLRLPIDEARFNQAPHVCATSFFRLRVAEVNLNARDLIYEVSESTADRSLNPSREFIAPINTTAGVDLNLHQSAPTIRP
jgi:hypothetical protein